MSAPQIPNLLASRGGPRSRGGRGRGRGAPGAPHGAQHRKDLDIQSTDTDAAVSRLSAVSLGYISDPYAPHFVNGPGTRRMPIINRGRLCPIVLHKVAQSAADPKFRNLHKDNRSRYLDQRLPRSPQPRRSPANQTNNIPGRRNRHEVLPASRAKEAS